MGNRNTHNIKKIELMRRCMLRREYSKQTIKSYISCIEKFFEYIGKDSGRISNEDINDYVEYLIFTRKLSGSYHNQFLNAYVFYCKLHHPKNKLTFNQRPRKSEFLPEVLGEDEIRMVINSIKNVKHKAIIAFIYCHGLRRSECINFKLSHFDKARGIIRIVQSKGKKDRYVILNSDCRDILAKYCMIYKPKEYLFEGQSLPYYSGSSIANILKNALGNCGITKRITPHSLRHSFATHLYDNGVDISKIQVILGHKRASTTRRYTKISVKTIRLDCELKLVG